MGSSKGLSGKPLQYKNSIFHRIIPGFAIQGGNVISNDGKGLFDSNIFSIEIFLSIGGESIYGRYFPDESFAVSHDKEGILTMANEGPNTNSSQFLITLSPAKWYDLKENDVFNSFILGWI